MRQGYTRERMDESAGRWLADQMFDCIVCEKPVRYGDSATLIRDGHWAGQAHEECLLDSELQELPE